MLQNNLERNTSLLQFQHPVMHRAGHLAVEQGGFDGFSGDGFWQVARHSEFGERLVVHERLPCDEAEAGDVIERLIGLELFAEPVGGFGLDRKSVV